MIDRTQAIQQLYTSELEPILGELEVRRNKLMQRALISGVVIVLVALGGGLALVLNFGPVPAVFALVLSVFAWMGINNGPISGFKASFKQDVIGRLIRVYDPNLSYQPENYIGIDEFRASQIYRTGIDRYDGEDLVFGRAGATAFRFSEVHAEYKTTTTDSKGNTQTTWHTIFKGVFFVIDFNKDFSGTTLVLPDTAERMFGGLGKALQGMSSQFSGRELVKLEDPEFERHYVVYSTDQIEARYILSTSLMRRLTEFRERFDVPVSLSFVNAQLYIGISEQKNLFEPPPIYQTVALSQEEIMAYLEDVRLAESIIEELNLNTRIWTKQ